MDDANADIVVGEESDSSAELHRHMIIRQNQLIKASVDCQSVTLLMLFFGVGVGRGHALNCFWRLLLSFFNCL